MRELHARRIREMAVEEVRIKINDLREELFNLSFRNSMRQLDNPLKIRETRRDLARLMTLLAEHEKGIRAFGAASAAPAPKRRAGAVAESAAETEAAPKAAKPKATKKAAAKPKAKAAKKKTAKKAAKPKAKPAKAKAAKKSGAAKAVTARRKSTAKRSARTTSK